MKTDAIILNSKVISNWWWYFQNLMRVCIDNVLPEGKDSKTFDVQSISFYTLQTMQKNG